MRYGKEKIQNLQKTSASVVTLPSGSVVTIGGQRKVLSSSLTVDTAITGVGGLESAVVQNTFYYVYAVLSGGVPSLIASTSNEKPSAFGEYKKVGAFYTEPSTTDIFKAYYFGEFNEKDSTYVVNSSSVELTNSGDDTVQIVASGGTGVRNFTFFADSYSVPPSTVGSPGQDSNTWLCVSTIPTISGFTTFTKRDIGSGAGGAVNVQIFVTITKQLIDAIQPDWKDY